MKERHTCFRCIVLAITLVMLYGCTYYSKESYMKGYKKFISEISENYKDYTERDWQVKEARYKLFSGEWYEKFENEFSTKDKIVLAGYTVKYNYYYALRQASDVVDGLLESLDD